MRQKIRGLGKFVFVHEGVEHWTPVLRIPNALLVAIISVFISIAPLCGRNNSMN